MWNLENELRRTEEEIEKKHVRTVRGFTMYMKQGSGRVGWRKENPLMLSIEGRLEFVMGKAGKAAEPEVTEKERPE